MYGTRPIERVKPPRCKTCGREPWPCPTEGAYQCACPVPWLAQRTSRHKIIPRQHYDPSGLPYVAKFEWEPYVDDEPENIERLISEEFAT